MSVWMDYNGWTITAVNLSKKDLAKSHIFVHYLSIIDPHPLSLTNFENYPPPETFGKIVFGTT